MASATTQEANVGGNGRKDEGFFEITNDDNWLYSPIVQQGFAQVYEIGQGKYLKTSEVLSLMSHAKLDRRLPFSPMNLSSYDKERHIPLSEAYDLIQSQNDPHLQVGALKEAIDNDQIHVYKFKGQEYLDRLDVGRVFHRVRPKEKRNGLTIERYFSKEGENPFDSVEYSRRDLRITGVDPKTKQEYVV